MKTMLENAKDLISKGKMLNDLELIQMGMDLLSEYGENVEQNVDSYICENCGHSMDVDKPRKACPKCKKHTLVLVPAISKAVEPKEELQDPENFITQIRKNDGTRTRYNENGEIEGVYTKPEQIGHVTNVWNDNDKEIGSDAANELLKKFTKVSQRTRPPVKMIHVKCEICGKEEDRHPLHVGGRARYVCDRCIRKGKRS